MKRLCILSVVLILASCSENSPISLSFNKGTTTTPPSVVETQKLVSAIQATPAYKIEDSEIALLKTEGVITDQDALQLKTIQ